MISVHRIGIYEGQWHKSVIVYVILMVAFDVDSNSSNISSTQSTILVESENEEEEVGDIND